MDERVFVSIKGLHFASGVQDSDSDGSEDEEVIETVHTGRYKRSGENEYIKYSDMIDGEDKPCSNLIKITPDGTVEITKKGYVTTHFSFVPGERTTTYYETPYGGIYLGINSKNIVIERSDERIYAGIEYTLELNHEIISESSVEIEISSKKNFKLEN